MSRCISSLGKLAVGDGYPVRVMGVINVSPESFYKGSVASTPEDIVKRVISIVEEGGDIIDVGGMSTAPYLSTHVPLEVEVERVSMAVELVKDLVDVPISVDTFRAKVAEEALKRGAEIVNDVTGLRGDPDMLKVLLDYGPSLIVCARVSSLGDLRDPVALTVRSLRETLDILESKGFDLQRVVVDPCIGFHRFSEIPWYVWDLTILSRLNELRALNRPILVGLSRKSFIGAILSKERPEDRLYGSLAYTVLAVLKGAHVIRTHDVAATKDVINAVEALKKLGIEFKVNYPGEFTEKS